MKIQVKDDMCLTRWNTIVNKFLNTVTTVLETVMGYFSFRRRVANRSRIVSASPSVKNAVYE